MRSNRFINICLFTVLVTFIMSSCKKDEDPGGTAMESMAGEWWVHMDDDPDNYYKISTYNTAANSSTEMWIDDNETFWLMKGKIGVNLSDLSFSGSKIENVSPDYVGSGETFTITNGKIFQKAAKGPNSKAVTDSIQFTVSFSDDTPAFETEYKFTGYRRTKYAEDDH